MDQLADSSRKIIARAAQVVGPVLPLTADEKFGTLAWSMVQHEDPMLGPVYGWVRACKRCSSANGPELFPSKHWSAFGSDALGIVKTFPGGLCSGLWPWTS